MQVFAVEDPWYERPEGAPSLQKLGWLYLDSPFSSSMFADTLLFFQHTFFADELARVGSVNGSREAAWRAYATEENMRQEGAAWYEPWLPEFESPPTAARPRAPPWVLGVALGVSLTVALLGLLCVCAVLRQWQARRHKALLQEATPKMITAHEPRLSDVSDL